MASLITAADLVPADVNFAFDVYVADTREAADLAVTKTDSPDPVTARANLTYTISVQNLGPGTASGVTLTDRFLPRRTSYLRPRPREPAPGRAVVSPMAW